MDTKVYPNDNAILLKRAKALRQNMSEAEQRLWQYLRAGRLQGFKFRRQQPLGVYIVDFVCTHPKLVVEADGGQHADQADYDETRSRFLQQQGFTVLRFWNHEILQQTDEVLAQILRTLQALSDSAEA